jgi:hypothetical protein
MAAAFGRGEIPDPGAYMEILAQTVLPLAAIGYSMVYLLAGGGVFGAVVIFIIAKMLGR